MVKPTTGSTAVSTVCESSAEAEKVNKLVKQLETRPLGEKQLVDEVKGVYAE